jgi:glycoprotein 3-alpha-L-fucosyltransferase
MIQPSLAIHRNDVVPIVMGAHPTDYAAIAPPNSFIHVDDFESPKELAEYLMKLDVDDTLYNRYLEWKGSGSFINTKFWCRVCAMLHEQQRLDVHTWYPSLQQWSTATDKGPVCMPKPSAGRWASWRHSPYNYTSEEAAHL